MNRIRCLLLLISAVLTMLVCGACSSGSGDDLNLVSVPDATGWTKQADIVMPGDLVDEAEYYLNLDYAVRQSFVQTATFDQRRAMIYIMAAYNEEMFTTDLIMTANDHAEGNEAEFTAIAAAMGGELTSFEDWDFLMKDWGVVRFAGITSRQAIADLADKVLKRYSDEVWYVEFNMPADLD